MFLHRTKQFLLSFRKPFKPDSPFIILWKSILLLAILADVFISTYLATFPANYETGDEDTLLIFCYISDFLYFFEILLSFRTCYYERGELICKPSKIAYRYVRTTFILDIISMLTILNYILPHNKVFLLLSLVRLYKLPMITALLEDYFQFSWYVHSTIQVLKLAVALFLFAHFCGCILYAIAKGEDEPETWITVNGLEGASGGKIYVSSLYWAVTTMSTVGYGDIHAVTDREKVMAVFLMIASSIIFGYIISTIGSIVREMDVSSSETR